MIDEVIARLKDRVPDLSGRAQGAAQFSALMKSGTPPVSPCAYVLPLGLRGGRVQSASGAFVQDMDEMVAVVLAYRSHDTTGAKGIDPLDALIRATLDAICGWATDDMVGVFALSRGGLVSMTGGVLIYQIDFAITDQLRIAT